MDDEVNVPVAPSDTTQPSTFGQLIGARSWACLTMPGSKRPRDQADGRATTEDRVLANGLTFAVADGASRPGNGGLATTLAIAEFALAVAAAPPAFDLRYRVEAAVAHANASV
jgi:hypothetical protein